MYAFTTSTPLAVRPVSDNGVGTCAPVRHEIRAAKHVQKKATKKHMDRRPKKSRPSDKYRTPPPFDVAPLLSKDLPSEYTNLGEVEMQPEVIPLDQLEGIQLIIPDSPAAEAPAAEAPAAEAPAAEAPAAEDPAAAEEAEAGAETVAA